MDTLTFHLKERADLKVKIEIPSLASLAPPESLSRVPVSIPQTPALSITGTRSALLELQEAIANAVESQEETVVKRPNFLIKIECQSE